MNWLKFFGQSVRTLRKNLKTAPDKVPPKLHLPKSKMLRWVGEVQSWMYEIGLRR